MNYIYVKDNQGEIKAFNSLRAKIIKKENSYEINGVIYMNYQVLSRSDVINAVKIGDLIEAPLTDDRLLVGEVQEFVNTKDRGSLVKVKNLGYVDIMDASKIYFKYDSDGSIKYNEVPLN